MFPLDKLIDWFSEHVGKSTYQVDTTDKDRDPIPESQEETNKKPWYVKWVIKW